MKPFNVLLAFLCITASSYATIYKVGPLRTYTMPSQVTGLVAIGDTVDIDAATYNNCAVWTKANLLLRGVGGRAHIQGPTCQNKGLWLFSPGANNITVENIEFSGAISTDKNGAGIRAQAGAFTVRNCYFHNNENGILCNDPVAGTSDVLVEYCEFGYNGYGDGQSHNMYIGSMKSFTLRYSYVHHAYGGGQQVKSRAYKNYILYNRISTESTGNGSRDMDLPNGGLAIIVGNAIEQGPNAANGNMLGYGLEGLINPGPHDVYVINNTFVNNRSAGSFIHVPTTGTGVLKTRNNIFAGNGTLILNAPATLDSANNFVTKNISSIGFVNAAAYDYQLLSTAKVIGKGINPGSAGTYSLTPVSEYVHNSNKRNRPTNGTIDIGAYEYTPTTGIKEQDNKIILSVFPNPASDRVEIITDPENAKLFITNILGEQIITKQIDEARTIIDVAGWAPGLYFITVQSNISKRTEKIQIVR